MKQKFISFLFAALAGIFLGGVMFALFYVCIGSINAGCGFAIWLGSLLACLSCMFLAYGYKPKFFKRGGKRGH